jgi:hypothetical protein
LREGVVVLRLDAADIVSLVGCRVRVKRGVLTFEGTLCGPSERKFPRGPGSAAYGCVVEGHDFQLEFAWWDWDISPMQPA